MCNNAIGSAEFYDHAKTEQWNSTIIVCQILIPPHDGQDLFFQPLKLTVATELNAEGAHL